METTSTRQNELPGLFKSLTPNFVLPDPESAPAIGWGILGLGGIAQRFADEVPRYSQQKIVAVGSRSEQKALDFAAKHGVDSAHAHGSYEALVNDPLVEAVYIATPMSRHKEDAMLALAAGKPVLVEKAFMMNEEEAKEVFDEAKRRDLFAMEAMWARTLPHYRWVKEVADSGALGKLTSVSADHGQRLTHIPRLMQPDLGGGAMLDLGVYPHHLVEMLMGRADQIRAVSRPTKTGVDAANIAATSHASGLAEAACQLDGWSPTQATMTFEGGTIQFGTPFYAPCEVTLTVFDEAAPGGRTQATWDARVPGGFQYEAADAAQNIEAGNLQSALVPWAATVEVQRVMDAVLEEGDAIRP